MIYVLVSEPLQVQVLMNEFEVFDKYRGKFLVGEMIWNFADFETDQGKFKYTTLH